MDNSEPKQINLSSIDWNNLTHDEFQFYAKEFNKLTAKKSKSEKTINNSTNLVCVKLDDGKEYHITEKLFDRLNKLTSEKSRQNLLDEIKLTHTPNNELDILKF